MTIATPEVRALRADLAAAPFTLASALGVWGDAAGQALHRGNRIPARRAVAAARTGGRLPAPAALAERLGLSRLELTARLREPVFACVAEEVPELCPVRVPADRLSGEIAIARALVARHQRRLGIQPAEEIEPVALVA